MTKTEAKHSTICAYLRNFRHGKSITVLLFVFALFAPLTGVFLFTREGANAATSSTLTFQARLLNSAGAVVPDGTYNLEFKLYDVSSGGSALWTDTRYDQNGGTAGLDYRITVKYGYFSINLADTSVGGTSFPTTINWDQELWLGMNVGGTTQTATPTWDGEMTPRFKLTAVPYAFKAGTALAVASNNTNAASTNSNAVSITSGNAAGATSNSGNITIDAGTATQTAGTLLFGTANASALTLGRTGITTTNSGALTVTQTLTASGNLIVSTLGSADTSTFICRNTSNQLATCSSTPLTNSLTDNIVDAFDLQEGTNNYFNINTTNGAEVMAFGNTTTNPDFNFLGSGDLSVRSNVVSFQNTADSSSALTVKNAAGTNVIQVDTSNGRIAIGGDVGGFSGTPTKLTNPSSMPSQVGRGTAFSPDSTYVAVATDGGSPYIYIYKRSGDTFTKLADPATLPAGNAQGVSWSPDGTYLVVGHDTSPYITIYKRSGDTFTKLTNPASLPTLTGRGSGWSADGTYLAIAHSSSPYFTAYKRSGDTFTKLSDPATLPTSTGYSATWSPDGTYLSIGHSTSPNVTIYKRSGDTLTKLSDPATLPAGTVVGTSWSPNGTYLVTANRGATPYITIYKRSGDTFTKLSDPATMPTGGAGGVSWTADSNYLAVAHDNSPYVTFYSRSGDTFTKLSDPATTPGQNASGVSFSAEGTYVAVSMEASPYFALYKSSGGPANRVELLASVNQSDGIGFGKEIQVYRSAANVLSLSAGSNLRLENGSLIVNEGSLQVTSGTTTLGGALTVAGTSSFSGLVSVSTLGTANTSTFLCRNSSNQLATCSSTPLTSSLTDNIADAFDLQEGTNNYININTTNSSENISFGNATTNPTFSFLGSGTTTFAGLLQGNLGLTTSGAAANINVSSNFATNINTGTSTGAVTIGNNTGNPTVAIDSGTGAISIGTGAQARTINIGTGAAAQTVTLGSTNTTSATTIAAGSGGIGLTGDITANNALTVTGLTTLNGGLTVQTGDTFTFNGDAFTDFTGGGLVNTGGVLTVDNSSASGYFQNGGNSFGGAATLGTNDANVLNFETGGTTQLTVTTAGNLEFNGAGTLTNTSGDLTIQGATKLELKSAAGNSAGIVLNNFVDSFVEIRQSADTNGTPGLRADSNWFNIIGSFYDATRTVSGSSSPGELQYELNQYVVTEGYSNRQGSAIFKVALTNLYEPLAVNQLLREAVPIRVVLDDNANTLGNLSLIDDLVVVEKPGLIGLRPTATTLTADYQFLNVVQSGGSNARFTAQLQNNDDTIFLSGDGTAAATERLRLLAAGGVTLTGNTTVASGNLAVDTGDNTFNVDASGNRVGIGTTGGTGKLTVTGATSALVLVESTGANNSFVTIKAPASQQAGVIFNTNNTDRYQLGVQTDNSLFLYDNANSRDAVNLASGNLTLNGVGGNVTIGNTAGTSSVTINSGSGGINLNTNTVIGDASTDRLTVTSQILGATPLAFQGATDNGFATSFAITEPTANNTITFPNASGTVLLGASGSGNGLVQVPTSNTAGAQGANYIAPTAASIVGLKVVRTTGTATNAIQVNTATVADTTAQVLIATGATTQKGLVVQRIASQTANIFEVQNESGTPIAYVTASGNVVTEGEFISQYSVRSSDAATASNAFTVRSGNTTGGTGLSTGSLTVKSGDGSGTNTSSGNVIVDVGSVTGTGTRGAITIGATNAASLALGRTGITTTNNGALTVAQNLTVDSVDNVLVVDVTNNRVGIGNTGSTGKLSVSGATSALALFESTGANNAYVTINAPTSQQSGIQFNTNGSTRFQFGAQTDNSFFLYDNANARDAIQVTTAGTVRLNPTGGNVEVGNTAGTTAITINSGTGAISIGTGAQARTTNIATGAAAQTVTLGSTNTTSATTIAAGSGAITFNASQAQFSEVTGTRTLTVQTRTTNVAGTALTISGGTAGSGAAAFTGGQLTLQGGNAAGTGNANGANVVISGGTGVGSGVTGLVVLATPTFQTATVQSFTGSGAITQANVDANSAILISSNAAGYTATLGDPTITTAGRVIYVTNSGTFDMTLSVNGGGSGNTITLKPSTTATMIWNGADWTAAGASSSTDLQAAYNNTATSAGGAELVLNAVGGAADGLTVRNNATSPIIGGIFEAQTSVGSNIFSVNNNATEYAVNGGAETSTNFSTNWLAAPAGGTVARNTTAAEVATGQASVSVVTTATASHGARNILSSTLTPSLRYNVSYTVKAATAGSSFTTLETMFSSDGSATAGNVRFCVAGTPTYFTGTASQSGTTITGSGTTWTSGMVGQIFVFANGQSALVTGFTSATSLSTSASYSQTVSSQNYNMYNAGNTVKAGAWSRVSCTFTAPASGMTANNSIFIRQTDATARTFYIDNLSVTVSADANHAVDGSVDDATNFATNWTQIGGATVARNTTTLYDTSASASVVTTATAGHGIRNNMSITPSVSTQYLVTFYARSSNTFNDIRVRYSRDGGTNFASCGDYNTQSVSTTGFTRITCLFTTDGTTATNPDLIIDQPTATARTFYVDALSVTLNTNTSNNVQIGAGSRGGPVTLFTLDRAASSPIAANNDAYLGSMYYDTTTGRIQCYEADGWGACGSAPDNYVNLNPEYAGAVLNGSGVGTMTADFCANQSGVLQVNTSLCASGESRNFYRWTSPQASPQTYSIYVSYQLPATFKGFSSDDTVQLTARTSNTTDGVVSYEMFKSESGALTACGTATTVTSVVDTWQTVGINGNESTSCSFTTASANAFVIFKINVTADSGANVYVGTLSFTTTGR